MTNSKGGRPSAHNAPEPKVEYAAENRRHTLRRDGDRDLQFDGTIVAEIESGGGPITHRAAVYRTRGGKYVAEFSSRPRPVVSPYRDPPERFPTPDERTEYKELFIGAVIETAEWREGKAQQFPDDSRNATSALALRSLATALDDVPVHDERWRRLWLAEYGIDHDLVEDVTSVVEAQNLVKSEMLRTYGFHQGASESVTILESLVFLDQAIDALKLAAQPEPPSKPSGKAQAFETLDEALAWFRPGHLTTSLLQLLGRMDPEFID